MTSRQRAKPLSSSGERSLWASVILNAIEDANGNIKDGGARHHTKMRLRKEALDWLTKPNKGFNEVCHLAGLDPMAVRERCQTMLPHIDEVENA